MLVILSHPPSAVKVFAVLSRLFLAFPMLVGIVNKVVAQRSHLFPAFRCVSFDARALAVQDVKGGPLSPCLSTTVPLD